MHKFYSLVLALFLTLPATLFANTERVGDVLFVLLPASAAGMSYYYDDKEGTQQFIKAFSVNMATTLALKLAINKTRPNGECCDSFPSGHTSVAFQGASFIQKRYGWKYGLPAYLGATYTGYSRIAVDKHELDDVLFGALLGIVSSHYFTTSLNNVNLSAFVADGRYGVSVSY